MASRTRTVLDKKKLEVSTVDSVKVSFRLALYSCARKRPHSRFRLEAMKAL